MVDYDETMKNINKKWQQKWKIEIFRGIFLLIQGGQGATQEGSELIQEVKKFEKMIFSKIGSDPTKLHHILGIQSSI